MYNFLIKSFQSRRRSGSIHMEYRVRRFFLQISGRNAKIIRFTCSIDISQYDVICKGKSFGKFRKKGFGTCISMRLEYTPDLLMWIILGCVKGGFNLCRMMRIIINDRYIANFAFILESAVCTAEIFRPSKITSVDRSRSCPAAIDARALDTL